MGIKEKKLFLLDMDGTLYLGNNLFPRVHEFLTEIKNRGGRYIFMTNNSSKSADKYVEKLAGLGIEATTDDFLTSADATAMYLEKKDHKLIYVLGTSSFTDQLRSAGFPVTTELSDDIDCLCMGFDTELTFKKLDDACRILKNDVEYIATNPDYVCPTEYGYVPDCGSVTDMLFNASGKRPHVIGKPNTDMPLLALEKYGYTAEETVIIGDRIYTDIACGVNAGIGTAFVLSGEGVVSDIEKYGVKPEFIYDNIGKILDDMLA